MDYRTLELTLVSAEGIKKPSLIGKRDVYAVAYISGMANNQKLTTPVDKDGDTSPTWNFPMKFTVNEAAGLQNRLTLIIEIKAVGTLGHKHLGEVRVPIKELLEGVSEEGKAQQFVNYRVRKPSGKPKGDLSFSYKFGEKFLGKAEEPVIVQQGSPAVEHPPEKNGLGTAFDVGMIGGLLMVDIMSEINNAGGWGGGCGGGWGGGCGGGGCGGF